MLTGGQLSSLSTGGGGVSPTSCDFEPNSSLNLVPLEGPESEEAPNMLPPAHPDRTAPATASESATRQPGPVVCIIGQLRIIRMSPKRPIIFGAQSKRHTPACYSSAIPAKPRARRSSQKPKVNRGNPRAAGRTADGPATPR